jgi:putative acetyltransferase
MKPDPPDPTTDALLVRDEKASDHEAVHALHTAAFGRRDEADLVDALRRDVRPQLSLVAERAGGLVGHVFFSPVRIGRAPAAPTFAALAPVGVLPEEQGGGAGSALVRAGLDRCPALGWKAVFLVGNPAYYGRFGFELAAPLGFRYQSEAFDPVLQVAILEPGALDGIEGEVVYPDAFDAV